MRVMSIGNVTADTSLFVRRIPKLNQEASVCSRVDSIGGSAAVCSSMFASLGWHSLILSRVGNDDTGARATRLLEDSGVDTSRLVRVDGQTGSLFMIYDESFNRCVYYDPGACALRPEDLEDQAIEESDLVVLCCTSIEVTSRAAQIAKSLGTTVVLNPSGVLVNQRAHLVQRVLPMVDFLFLNRAELTEYSGASSVEAACDSLCKHGQFLLVATLGAEGCLVWGEDLRQVVPGYGVAARYPSGAGDWFLAAFLHTFCRVRDTFLAADFANAVGAAATLAERKLEQLPTSAEIDLILRSREAGGTQSRAEQDIGVR